MRISSSSSRPTVPGFGNASGFELRLQDKTAGTFAELDEVAKSFVAKLNADPRLSGVTSGFNPNFPQYLLRVDLAKAAKLGIDVNESMETLQSYVGSFYSSNFVRFGQMYKVMLQAAPEYRMNPEDLFGLYAKNKEGNMVPYSNFMTMERVYGPSQITRYNLFTSAMITGEQAPGVSSGEALEAVEEIAAEVLPRGYDIEWSGVAVRRKNPADNPWLFSRSVWSSSIFCWRPSMKAFCAASGYPLASGGCVRIVPFAVCGGTGEQHLCPGGARDADRPLGQECDPDYRGGEPVPQGRCQHYGSGHPGGDQPLASDPDDFLCLYQRLDPVGDGQWRGCFGQSLHRNGGGRRYADRYFRGDLPDTGAL